MPASHMSKTGESSDTTWTLAAEALEPAVVRHRRVCLRPPSGLRAFEKPALAPFRCCALIVLPLRRTCVRCQVFPHVKHCVWEYWHREEEWSSPQRLHVADFIAILLTASSVDGEPATRAISQESGCSLYRLRCLHGVVQRGIGELEELRLIGRFFNGASPFILVKDVDVLKKVLVEDFSAFSDRGALFTVLPAPVKLNAMVFTAPKDRWKALRQTVSPAFTTSKLSQTFHTFEACGGSLANIIASECKSGNSIDVVRLLRRYSLDVMLKAGYSVDMNVLASAPGSSFDRLTAEGVRLLQTMGLQGVTLVSRKADSGIFTSAEVLYNACVYVFAGFDGTTHAVVAALYALALHQDIQEKLRKEITSVLNKEGKLTYETIGQLKYMDMCMYESMRLYYQNVGFVTRRANKDVEYNGIKIPKGVSVMAATSCLNHDRKDGIQVSSGLLTSALPNSVWLKFEEIS
ncbi:hypothetical protein HPB50_017403 [Hyalomma asiaticum]|uniref:Uncharacterized protein n=1 Tax=Hyalomma asiaticum TaxID=266040 RepID=A0ACB7T007_HYAAI|nr:hypothetical protein HPB50_017403 [Hyalomma asiaticum]